MRHSVATIHTHKPTDYVLHMNWLLIVQAVCVYDSEKKRERSGEGERIVDKSNDKPIILYVSAQCVSIAKKKYTKFLGGRKKCHSICM